MDAPKGITSDTIDKIRAVLSPPADEPEAPVEGVEATPEEIAETPEEPVTAKTYKVKVDGEEVEVPEDELLKGYSRTKDYTKKTQKLAEERKALEENLASVKSEREQYSKALDALGAHLKAAKEPDWEKLSQDDPIEFVKQKEFWRDRKEQFAVLEAEKRRVAELQAQDQQKAFEKYLEAEQSRLLDALPEWKKDAAKAKADKEAIANLALSHGYTEQEIAQIFDHRAVLIMRKAAMYDEMMSKAKSQTEKVKDSPKTARPGNLQPATRTKEFNLARENLKQRGRVDDFVTAFKSLQRK